MQLFLNIQLLQCEIERKIFCRFGYIRQNRPGKGVPPSVAFSRRLSPSFPPAAPTGLRSVAQIESSVVIIPVAVPPHPKLQWIKRLSRASFLRNRTGAARILARIEVRPYIMLFLSAIYCNAGSTSGVQVIEAVLTSPSTVVQRSVSVCSFSSVGALVKTITGDFVCELKSVNE